MLWNLNISHRLQLTSDQRVMREMSRRNSSAALTLLGAVLLLIGRLAAAVPVRDIAPGPYKPNWDSIAQTACPEWFRDAKLGLWARWGPQSVPARGDDYARNLYLSALDVRTGKAHPDFTYQVEHYGPPSQTGFKDVIRSWTASRWEPDSLMALYRRAGARYFVALANDSDNFDCYNSKYQSWNSVAVGPHQDIVGRWAEAARAAGLHFGVSVHAARAWTWFEPAQGSDHTGPLAGRSYDGRRNLSDGLGLWWNGLNPQELYAQNHPLGAPPDDAYITKFYLRTKDLIDHYQPDLLDFDTVSLPFGEAGLSLAAHYYNTGLMVHAGKAEVVLNAHQLQSDRRTAVVESYERSASDRLMPDPWQAETSIGQWQYKTGQPYRSVTQIVRMLVDVVSKNGNLLLDLPLRGDGTLDDDEQVFLNGLGQWMDSNAEGLYGTRPWKIFGEGPSPPPPAILADARATYTPQDIRFTQTKDGRMLYAFFFGWPPDGKLTVRSLAQTDTGSGMSGPRLASLTLLGSREVIPWTQDAAGLHVTLPAHAPNAHACALKLVFE